MKEDELKKALSGLLKDAKEKKALEEETRKAKNEEDRRNIFESVGKDIGKVIGPYIDAMNARDEASHTAMGDSLKKIITESIKIDAPSVDTQGIQDVLSGAFASLKIPEPVVNYTAPAINVPPIEMPDSMTVDGEVSIKGVSKKTPFPVMLMGPEGKPMTFSQAVMNAGGGRGDFFTIKDIQNSSGGSLIDNDGFLRVTGAFSVSSSNSSTQAVDSSNNVYNQANPFPVVVVSGGSATTASALVDSSGVQYSGSNPLPITGTITANQGATGPGDGSVALRIIQAGDSVSSTNILQFNGNTPATGLNETTVGVLRVTIMTDTAQSANVAMIGGATPATGLNETTTGVLRMIQMSDNVNSANVVSFNGVTPSTGLNETTAGVLRTVLMTDAVSSTNLATALDRTIDSISVSQVSGFTDSVFVTGSADSMLAHQARTTNPTALSDGADIRVSTDKLGRTLTRPMQVRELIATAYASLTNGSETTLATAASATYLDLIAIMCANTSTGSAQIDIRAGSAGNIVQTIYVPANSTAGWTPPVPWPQDATGNAWTADNADVTNSTVYVTALFSKEV